MVLPENVKEITVTDSDSFFPDNDTLPLFPVAHYHSCYTLVHYGSICGGSFENYDAPTMFQAGFHDQEKVPFQFFEDYLVFQISYGGSVRQADLVWDGLYHINENGQRFVNLSFVFKSSLQRNYDSCKLAFNLKPLQLHGANEVLINFKGYEELLKYNFVK